jgi:hypothetical protein
VDERLEKTLASLERYLFQVRLEGDDLGAITALGNVARTCALELEHQINEAKRAKMGQTFTEDKNCDL